MENRNRQRVDPWLSETDKAWDEVEVAVSWIKSKLLAQLGNAIEGCSPRGGASRWRLATVEGGRDAPSAG